MIPEAVKLFLSECEMPDVIKLAKQARNGDHNTTRPALPAWPESNSKQWRALAVRETCGRFQRCLRESAVVKKKREDGRPRHRRPT